MAATTMALFTGAIAGGCVGLHGIARRYIDSVPGITGMEYHVRQWETS